jgi:hypothetical protein
MKSLRGWFERRQEHRSAGRQRDRRSRPDLESLESRVVLYSATGNAWLNPAVVTLSFMPDGTNLGGATSNLISTFNSNPGLSGRWQNEILRAAQVWAQQTNINFVVVPDDGAVSGGGNYQEGDPGHGDIRIGGYNYGNTALASAYQPPPINNFSVAGDITFNTGMTWNIGTTFDLFTVASHEIGHALGVGHSSAGSNAIMYPTYVGKKIGLAADDIAGIRSIYSAGAPRSQDIYNSTNSSFATAADLSGSISPVSLTASVADLDIAAAGQAECFTVSAPAGTTGTMTVTAQSQGLSLLAPKLSVYAADQVTLLGTAISSGQYGTTLTVTVPNITPGQQLFVRVRGADTTAFGTGNYSLGLSFGNLPPPTEASPVIAFANGTPLSSGGGTPDSPLPDDTLFAPPTITGISPDTGASTNDGFTSANRISISGTAGTSEPITVYRDGKLIGTSMSDSSGKWTFNYTGTALADGTYSFTAMATDPDGPVSSLSYPFAVTVDTAAPASPVIGGIVAYSAASNMGAITADSTPVLFGTAQPYSRVMLYYQTNVFWSQNSSPRLLGNVAADSNGNWNFTDSDEVLKTFSASSFTAQATDLAGNVSMSSAPYFVVMAPAPTSATTAQVLSASLAASSILGINPDGSFNTVAKPTLSGLATQNSLVAVLEDGVIIGSVAVDSAGNWSFTCPALRSGLHRFSFEAVNQLGTFSAAVDPVKLLML